MQVVKYGLVGALSTLIHICVAWTYMYFTNGFVAIANIAAFLVAYVFSYLAQSKIVFKSGLNLKKALRFFFIQFIALLIAMFLSDFTDQNGYVKTVLIIFVMPIITFLIHKFWTFKQN